MILRLGEQQTIHVSPNHSAHSEEFIAWKFENVKFGSIREMETGGKLFLETLRLYVVGFFHIFIFPILYRVE